MERKETCCHHMGYSFQLADMVLLYASSHRQDNTYHGLCYTSHGALAGTRNSAKLLKARIDDHQNDASMFFFFNGIKEYLKSLISQSNFISINGICICLKINFLKILPQPIFFLNYYYQE